MTPQHSALRMALTAMLTDVTYTEAWKSRPWVEARLDGAAWSDTTVSALQTLAIRWAYHCDPRQGLALRKAFGETLTEEEEDVLRNPARLPSTRRKDPTPTPLRGETPMILETTPEVTQEMKGLMEPRFAQELSIVAEEFKRPPYFYVEKDNDDRLSRAVALVVEGKVHRRPDGLYEVTGSKGDVYTCNGGCSCPDCQKGRNPCCYHLIAKELYKEVCARVGPRQAPLLVAPPTIEERLAQAPQEGHQATIPQEEVPAAMSEPEAILEPPRGQNEALIAWTAQRTVLTQFIREHLKEGVDFGKVHVVAKDKCTEPRTCRVAWHWSKDTLFKSGSEKVCGLLRLRATFRDDAAVWEMLGRPAGVLCLVCELLTPAGEVVGEGRGCRDVKKDYGDVNKSVKMAAKSAQLDAVLRLGSLSDLFTQDLDDEDEKRDTKPDTKEATPTNLNYQALSTEIMDVLKRDGFTGLSLADYKVEVKRRTGLDLVRENYEAILAQLPY